MRVERIRIESSPSRPETVRLCANVRFARGRPKAETLWIEVPSAFRDALDESGDPWAAALTPLAATLDEPLELEAPVDRSLLAGMHEVMTTWRSWYRTTAIVSVTAPEPSHARTPPPRRTMSFFSGGVDSFFSALGGTESDGIASRGPIDDLVFLEGFDLRLSSRAAIARAKAGANGAAASIGTPVFAVSTNFRETRWDDVDWPLVGNGAVLAAISLALGRGFDRALIPGSIWKGACVLVPWGSHPLTDGCFSSRALQVRPDGAETDRFEKVASIAAHPAVHRALRVCYRSPDGGNCSACAKCLLVMSMLEAVGSLDRVETFDARDGWLDRLAAMDARFPSDRRHLGRVLDAARAAGRQSLADAVSCVLAKASGYSQMAVRRPSRLRRWLGRA